MEPGADPAFPVTCQYACEENQKHHRLRLRAGALPRARVGRPPPHVFVLGHQVPARKPARSLRAFADSWPRTPTLAAKTQSCLAKSRRSRETVENIPNPLENQPFTPPDQPLHTKTVKL